MASRSQPLSIESLLKKQREEKEAASKVHLVSLTVILSCLTPLQQPKFLTKEERAKLALAKREQEIKDQREKDEKRKTERDALERDAEEVRQKELQTSSSKYSRCQYSSLSLLNSSLRSTR
jgi:ATP-dependent RNA helicase DDX23/PRP28